MDILDDSKYEFLLPRRAREAIGLAVVIGIAFVPPVQRWYLDQIEHHAQHIAREVTSQLASNWVWSYWWPREAAFTGSADERAL